MECLPMQHLVKKNKFTHVSNNPKSIRENFIQAIHSENSSSQHFTLNDLTALSYDKKNNFSMFHYFDELQTFLSNYPIDFQILGISESRLKTDTSTTTNIQLPGFNIELMPTKSANSSALLYIKDTINYKLRPDFNVEKEKELESISIKMFQKPSKNIIIGCI